MGKPQFLSAHGEFNKFLHTIKKRDSAICDFRDDEETVEHVVLHCVKYSGARVKMSRTICSYSPALLDLVSFKQNFHAFESFIN